MDSLRSLDDASHPTPPPPLKADDVAAVMYVEFCGQLAELLLYCSLVVWAASIL